MHACTFYFVCMHIFCCKELTLDPLCLNILSSSSLKRAMRPSVLTQITLSSGDIHTFEVGGPRASPTYAIWQCLTRIYVYILYIYIYKLFFCKACKASLLTLLELFSYTFGFISSYSFRGMHLEDVC